MLLVTFSMSYRLSKITISNKLISPLLFQWHQNPRNAVIIADSVSFESFSHVDVLYKHFHYDRIVRIGVIKALVEPEGKVYSMRDYIPPRINAIFVSLAGSCFKLVLKDALQEFRFGSMI